MAGLESVGWSFTRLFRKNETGFAETPEGYLKLTTKCMEQARKMSVSTSLKFNHGQCKFLVTKLEMAVQSAHSLLQPWRGFSFKDLSHSLQVFKFLFALAKEVETFIQSCCKDAWIQAAIFLTDVYKHVSSVGFNLEVFTIVFPESNKRSGRRALTLPEVARVSEGVVKTVKEEASFDKVGLMIKVQSFIESNKSRNENHLQLAIFLLERLEQISFRNLSVYFSPSNLCERFSSLEQKESLGRGATATVHKALWLGAEVAKKTFIGVDNSDFKKEVSILARLSHPNIISLFGYGIQNHTCFIVMEVMDGDLFSLILRRLEGNGFNGSPFTIFEAVDIMHQVAEGVFYLHQNRIVHRDLKSHNILVRCVKARSLEIEYVHVKVADFGLSKIKERSSTFSNQTPNMGTTRWMAPEMILFHDDDSQAKTPDCEDSLRYPFKSDAYSFAMVCYEILTGHQPFSSIQNPREVKKKILDGDRPQLPDQCPINLKTLIEICWNPEAEARPCFGDICEELRYLKCLLMNRAREYSLSEVVAVTANFKMVIGGGGFGPIYYGKSPDGKEVAVRALDKTSRQGPSKFFNEVQYFSKVHHKHLVSLVGYCIAKGKQMLIYKYIHNGSLRDHLNGDSSKTGSEILDWKTRLNIGLQAAQGLEYLHTGCSPSLIHRNVRSKNILITYKYNAKVADFGQEPRLVEEDSTHDTSTGLTRVVKFTAYLDPE